MSAAESDVGPVVREILEGESALAFAALRALRPHIQDAAELVQRVDEVQRPQGYRLAGVFVPGRREAVAAAGFRTVDNLVSGHLLYVDDLVTAEGQRRRGYARILMSWLIEETRRLGCAHLQLDSATHRHAAHRLYLTAGLDITSFHFGLEIARLPAD